ncbi:MAG: nucleotidyltransferase domain-containing protein [Bacillota bacterium]
MTNNEFKKHLNSIVKKIEQEIPIEEIILFGSYVYGTNNEDSDIDLCILSKLKGKRKLDIIRKARKAIIPITSKPVDILLYDKNEFYDRANITSSFEHKIKNEGVRVL